MKALSICQPWAQLIVCGIKRIETRSWRTDHRGRLAIHASKTFTTELRDIACREPVAAVLAAAGFRSIEDLPRGGVIGLVTLVDCRPAEDLHPTLAEADRALGDFGPGRWGWLLAHPVRLVYPFAYPGALGVFAVPDELFAELRCA